MYPSKFSTMIKLKPVKDKHGISRKEIYSDPLPYYQLSHYSLNHLQKVPLIHEEYIQTKHREFGVVNKTMLTTK